MVDTIVFYLAAVVAIYAVLQGCLWLTADLREERLRAEAMGPSLRRPTLADGVSPWLQDIFLSEPVRKFDKVVQTSGVKSRTEQWLLGMMFATAFSVLLCHVAFPFPPVLSFLLGIGLGSVLPFFILLRLRDARVNKFTDQLPEALDMMVRSLKAGHPIPVAIALIGKEMPDPIGAEFRLVADSMTFGLDLRDALLRMTHRLNTSTELKYVVSAMKIQHASGGNLGDVLGSLAVLMRERKKLKMKVRAISAEGRVSGYILSSLPVVVVLAISILNPTFYARVGVSPVLTIIMGGAAALVFFGFLVVRRIVNIQV